jgi:hypothetical protein
VPSGDRKPERGSEATPCLESLDRVRRCGGAVNRHPVHDRWKMISFTDADIFKFIENHTSKTNQFESDSLVESGIPHVDDNSAAP